MEVRAVAKYLRLSPRKARLVTDLIRGRAAEDAIAVLANVEKAAALPVSRALRSAIANAENNFNLTMENLYVKDARADEGPRMKRVWIRGRGRRDIKLHRMCRITVVVDEREAAGRRRARATARKKEAAGPGSSGGPARASEASPSGFASPSPGRSSGEREE